METEIEVFRAGTPASRGITVEQISEVASYDCSEKPVPLCFGHPKSDDPAAGGISGFRVEGNSLFAKVASMTEAAIDGIKSGAWLDRSMAFFDPTHEANPRPGKWSPRHVGLLGGAAPGIPGMAPLRKALAFDADGGLLADGAPADAVVYAGAPTNVITIFEAQEPIVMERTPEQIAADEKRATEFAARETAFAERVRNQFMAANNTAIDALVRETKVLPAEADALKLAFNALDPEGDELTFGAGDKATKATAVSAILNFMAGLPKRVPTGERTSPSAEFDATHEFASTASLMDAAKNLAKEKGIPVEDAVAQLSGE